jgi:excisionase family DNA binding protein
MAAGSASGAASAIPELLSPADVAQSLGVSEADVLAALGDGSLKGKKIGSAWRITRVALDEFLKH